MEKNKKFLQTGVVLAMTFVMAFYAITAPVSISAEEIDISNNDSVKEEPDSFDGRLNLWYYDDSMTGVLYSLCNRYQEETGVRVTPILKNGMDFLVNISECDLSDSEYPDLYITGSSNLEEAALLEIAKERDALTDAVTVDRFCEKAIDAVTYKGNKIAYPMSFDTAFMVYNRSYLETYAKDQLEAALTQEAIDNADDAEKESIISVEASEQDINELADTFVPKTFDDLMQFGNEYDAPEAVTAVVAWDAEDIFYNFAFLGDSVEISGKYGDDGNVLDIVNRESVASLHQYQTLLSFFSTGDDSLSYENIRDGFIAGQEVFAIVSSDIVRRLDKEKELGGFEWDYEIETIPYITEKIPARPLAITKCMCVNAKSQDISGAEAFADFVASVEGARILYEDGGMLSPLKEAKACYPDGDVLQLQYENSFQSPKLMQFADFWMQLEIAFSRARDGDNAAKILKDMNEAL